MADKRLKAPVIEPNAVYLRDEVAMILDLNERTLDRLEDLPWSDVGERSPRMLGSALLGWLHKHQRNAAA